MKNPNGPSIEDVDDWNDSLRDKIDANTTRSTLLEAVDIFEANRGDDPELCGLLAWLPALMRQPTT